MINQPTNIWALRPAVHVFPLGSHSFLSNLRSELVVAFWCFSMSLLTSAGARPSLKIECSTVRTHMLATFGEKIHSSRFVNSWKNICTRSTCGKPGLWRRSPDSSTVRCKASLIKIKRLVLSCIDVIFESKYSHSLTFFEIDKICALMDPQTQTFHKFW